MSKIQKLSEFTAGKLWCIHGKSGIGKTTLAASFPKPLLFLDVGDNGLGSIVGADHIEDSDKIDFVSITSSAELLQLLQSNEVDKYKTIVIDHLTQLSDLIVAEQQAIGAGNVMNQNKWGIVNTTLKMIINKSKAISNNDTDVVLLAHSKLTGASEDEQALFPDVPPKFEPWINPSVVPKLEGSVNIAIYMDNVSVKKKVVLPSGIKKEQKVIVRAAFIGTHENIYTKLQIPNGDEKTGKIGNPTYKKIMKHIRG